MSLDIRSTSSLKQSTVLNVSQASCNTKLSLAIAYSPIAFVSQKNPRKCVTAITDAGICWLFKIDISILNPSGSTSINVILKPASSKELTVVGNVNAEANAVNGFPALRHFSASAKAATRLADDPLLVSVTYLLPR